MSDQNTQNYETAAAHMLHDVFAPVFFQKLAADYGIAPSNEAEAVQMIQLADKIRYAREVEGSKAAGVQSGLVSAAHSRLDQALGLSGQPASYDEATVVKAAHDMLSKVPDLKDAALLCQDAINQQLAA